VITPKAIFWIVVLGLVLLAVEWTYSVTPYRAILRAAHAESVMYTNATEGLVLYEQVLATKTPYRPAIRFMMRDQLARFSSLPYTSEQLEAALRVSTRELDQQAKERPTHTKTAYAAATQYRFLGAYDASAFASARMHALNVIELAPEQSLGYEEMSDIEFAAGNAQLAFGWLEQASRREQERHQGRFAYKRAAILAQQGDIGGAFGHLQVAERLGYPVQVDAALLVAISESLPKREKEREELAVFFEKIRAYPYFDLVIRGKQDVPNVLAAGAKIYSTMNETERAQELLDALTAQYQQRTTDYIDLEALKKSAE
jgi:hypothetical protein